MYAMRRLLLPTILLSSLASPTLLSAQQSTARDPLSRSYEKVLSDLELQFVAVAKALPKDQYDFTPVTLGLTQGNFEGVRTFAAEVKHVTEMNFVMYSVMSGLKPDIDMSSIGALKNKDEIVDALTRSFVFAHEALGTLTLSNAGEMPKDSKGYTRAGIAAFAMVHDSDHFGQLSEYLRMNGIIPPQSRK